MSIIFVDIGSVKKKKKITNYSAIDSIDLAAYKKFRMNTRGDESLINRSTPKLHDAHDAALTIFVLITDSYRVIIISSMNYVENDIWIIF